MKDLMEAISGVHKRNEGDTQTGLDLDLSVKEMKEKLNLKRAADLRRREGRRKSGDWLKQYKMIQNL